MRVYYFIFWELPDRVVDVHDFFISLYIVPTGTICVISVFFLVAYVYVRSFRGGRVVETHVGGPRVIYLSCLRTWKG
jgi:hypothetical protein